MDWFSLFLWISLNCAVCLQGVLGIRLIKIQIPPHIVRGQDAKLQCNFDLEGEPLYSVKWYKDGKEFYRYVPNDSPPAQVFNLLGVTVDLASSTDKAVVLKSVDLNSSGKYRCEVSAEAPSFQTVSEINNMTVVDLPDEGPKITGGRPRYQIGDTVNVSCMSAKSKPAAHLTWFINGEPADENFLHGPIVEINREGLETSTLGLEFKVKHKHFKKGDLKLKCLATIATVYWKSNEESVEGDRPQKAPVLESREETASPREYIAHDNGMSLEPSCVLLLISAYLGGLLSR